jgi:hypothetical protein
MICVNFPYPKCIYKFRLHFYNAFSPKRSYFMILLFYTVLNGIVIYLFQKKKKNVLHSLEVMVYWMVAAYVYQNFSAICFMNFKTLEVPNNLVPELAHFLNRTVLFPILLVTFMHFYLLCNTVRKKLFLMAGSIFLFVGLEWLADLLGVLKHVDWKLWWSFAYWFSALVFVIGFMKFFRKILYKKGGHL